MQLRFWPRNSLNHVLENGNESRSERVDNGEERRKKMKMMILAIKDKNKVKMVKKKKKGRYGCFT